MKEFETYSILGLVNKFGKAEIEEMISAFSCPLNMDVENFQRLRTGRNLEFRPWENVQKTNVFLLS